MVRTSKGKRSLEKSPNQGNFGEPMAGFSGSAGSNANCCSWKLSGNCFFHMMGNQQEASVSELVAIPGIN